MRPKLDEGQLLLLTKKHLIFVSRFVVIPPLSPEREICDILLLSFIQTKWNQLSTDFVGPPFFQERSIVFHAFLFLAFLFLRFRKVEEV